MACVIQEVRLSDLVAPPGPEIWSLLTGTINSLAEEASGPRQLTHLSHYPALIGNNEGMCQSPLDHVF